MSTAYPPSTGEYEQLLAAATRLFAELGYDQTETEMVAGAAGLPASSITKEFGGKRELYLEVFRRVHASELALVREFQEAGFDRDRYHEFLDLYFDYLLEHPENAALMVQRWMNDAADLREIEKTFVMPQAGRMRAATKDVFRPEVDGELMAWTVAWAVQIFVLNGIPGHEDAKDPEDTARFRRHLHHLADMYLKP